MNETRAMTMDAGLQKNMFYDMLRIRLVEETIAKFYPEQEMRCPVHLSIGQEAVAVGVCKNLKKQDFVFSNHRSHGHYLAKGGDLRAMVAEIYGKTTGCCKGKGGSMHLIDISAGFLGAVPIVGSTIPIAVGAALGSQMLGENRLTAAFFGDGTVEEGVFHESLNFAALKKLPVLFVCENNFYSVYSPLSVRQPAGREICSVAQGHGIPSFSGDGNNVVDVFRLTQDAVRIIKQKSGPVFLEFKTYRWREHCGPFYDNDIGYRSPAEFEDWKARCPIEFMEKHLLEQEILTPEKIESMRSAIFSEINSAVEYAKQSPFPDSGLLLEDVYAR